MNVVLRVGGNIMNGKLLKVCAAVMLIAGMGNADAAPYGKKGDKSLVVNMSTKIIAQVSMESPDGERKVLKFYNDNGSKADDKDREIEFKVRNVAASPEIIIEAGNNVIYDNGGWYVLNSKAVSDSLKKNENYNLGFSLSLLGPDGKVRKLEGGKKYQVVKGDEDSDGRSWVLRVDPDDLTESIEDGEYRGSLKIRLEAKS